jgi:transmembrane sensor
MDDELLLRFILGQATSAERAAIARWLAASPANQVHLAELRAVLEAARRYDVEATGSAPAAAEIVRLADRRIDARRRWLGRLGVGLAAAAAVVIAVGVLADRGDDSTGFVFGAGEFVTGAQAATVQLGDGSVVRLAPASRLQVDGSGNQRIVTLEGRAYFAVAKLDGKPFQVRTDAGLVTVLGTQFDLQAGADSLALVVVEGRVAVATGDQRATVASGEASRIKGGHLASPTKVTDVQQRVAWAGNFLVFQTAPLTQVAAEIEQHYGVRVAIADSVLARRTVTAWLSDRSLADALEVVCTIADADCTVRDSVVTVRPR